MNKLFDLKLKTIPRESYGSNNNAKHSKNIKTYKDDSSLLEQLKSEINSITDKNSENNLSMHDNLIQSSGIINFYFNNPKLRNFILHYIIIIIRRK